MFSITGELGTIYGGTILPSPAIRLKEAELWDVIPAGVKVTGDIFELDNLVAFDDFNDGVLDPVLWGTSLLQGTGSATVIEANGKVTILTTTLDASAILFYNAILSPRAGSIWRLKYKASVADFLGIIPGLLMQQAGTPTSGGVNLKSIASFEIDVNSRLGVAAWFADLLKYFFNGTWQNGVSYIDSAQANEQKVFELDNDGVNLTYRIFNADESECLFSTSLPWATFKAEADDLYMTFGDPFSGSVKGQFDVDEFYHYGPYPTGQVITMGEITLSGNKIERFPVTTSGNVVGEYKTDAGWIKPGAGTDAQMQAALIGLMPDKLDLRYTLNSDGLTPATVNLGDRIVTGVCLPPSPVIDEYIMPLIAELVRDQIGLIIITEMQGLKATAEDLVLNQPMTPQGIQAQKDLDNGIYDIINNIFIEKGTHFDKAELPGLNLTFSNSDYSATEGDAISRQVSNSNYAIEVHVQERHKQENDIIELGDEKSARKTQRILGLLRGIFMSGQYVKLGDEFAKIVWMRRVTNIDPFRVDYQESDGSHGFVGFMNISVKFNEIGPEISGELLTSTITHIKTKLRTADDGKIITIET